MEIKIPLSFAITNPCVSITHSFKNSSALLQYHALYTKLRHNTDLFWELNRNQPHIMNTRANSQRASYSCFQADLNYALLIQKMCALFHQNYFEIGFCLMFCSDNHLFAFLLLLISFNSFLLVLNRFYWLLTYLLIIRFSTGPYPAGLIATGSIISCPDFCSGQIKNEGCVYTMGTIVPQLWSCSYAGRRP